MTGPERYREAERLLKQADAALETAEAMGHTDVPTVLTVKAHLIAAAQVHATLALAAATAEPIAQGYDSDYDTTIPRAWSEAIS